MLIFAASNGYTDKIPVNRIADFKRDFLQYMRNTHGNIGQSIVQTKTFSPDITEGLKQALTDFLASSNYQ